jgi:hypothetical protein
MLALARCPLQGARALEVSRTRRSRAALVGGAKPASRFSRSTTSRASVSRVPNRHNGGNGSSYGELTRLPDEEAMVFWITNQYPNKADGWNLYRLGPELTQGVADRAFGDQ